MGWLHLQQVKELPVLTRKVSSLLLLLLFTGCGATASTNPASEVLKQVMEGVPRISMFSEDRRRIYILYCEKTNECVCKTSIVGSSSQPE